MELSARMSRAAAVKRRRMAGLAAAACATAAIGTLVFLVLGPGRSLRGDVLGGVGGASFVLLSLAYACVGAVLAARVPENPIGWMFCATGLAFGVTMLSYGYARYGLYATAQPLAGASLVAALPSDFQAGLLGLTVLLFPDGHLPSRRWRPAAVSLLLAMALLAASNVLRPGPLNEPFATVSNPLGIPGWRMAMDVVNVGGWILVVVGTAAAAASVAVRLRRARGVERQQLKLVLAVGVVAAAVTTLVMTSWWVWPHGDGQIRIGLIGLAFAAFPVAAGIAILRYRLYDIDVVINRTLVYGALTATLAAAYVGSVLLLQVILQPLTADSGLAIAASTLAVAALFRPARSHTQALVDRRFFRRRYDTQRTLEAFVGRLRDEVALDVLRTE
ncbi:MAG: hypothetical protein M3417_11725, partial [Actinomycetota bacterium]|nr:hypothetical protein [Actinomycetota bacterium]